MNIQVNIVELASELAHEELIASFNVSYPNRSVYNHDETGYSSDAQDTFDALYDKYYDIISKVAIDNVINNMQCSS
jgi:hypothetical protein